MLAVAVCTASAAVGARSTLRAVPASGGDSAVCYPLDSNYQTGSCVIYKTGKRTQTSLVYGDNQSAGSCDHGWWVFDISGIPSGVLINGVTLHAYCADQYYPYWALTRITKTDPRVSQVDSVYTDIYAYGQHPPDTSNPYGENPSYYRKSFASASPGWNAIDLGTYGRSDLAASLARGWFPVGLDDFDEYYYYFIEFQGWNEENKPYIVVTYTTPTQQSPGRAVN